MSQHAQQPPEPRAMSSQGQSASIVGARERQVVLANQFLAWIKSSESGKELAARWGVEWANVPEQELAKHPGQVHCSVQAALLCAHSTP